MDFVWRAEDRLLEIAGTSGWAAGTYTTEDINRPFRVFFDACASYPEPTEWQWFIDGVESASSPSLACNSYFHEFPKEGNYQVTLKSIKTVDGVEEVTAWTTKTVTVKDHLMVSLGDSYSSGEGNPPWTNAIDSETCHRSGAAASAQTALRFEQADPLTSVTFLHLACTGATVNEGLLGAYTSKGLPPQMSRAAGLLADRRLDVDTMFVSIGGNDIHFSSIIADCMEMVDCHKERSVTTRLRDDIAALPARYDRVAACIGVGGAPGGCELGSAGGIGLSTAGKTFVTQYPDATRDQNGAYCNDVLGALHYDGIWAPEFEWAAQSVMGQSSGKGTKPGLNDEIASAAGRHGWTYFDGVEEAFRTRGYCSSNTWFVSLTELFVQQRAKEGSFHPNLAGHTTQADIITLRVKSAMDWQLGAKSDGS